MLAYNLLDKGVMSVATTTIPFIHQQQMASSKRYPQSYENCRVTHNCPSLQVEILGNQTTIGEMGWLASTKEAFQECCLRFALEDIAMCYITI